MASRIPLSRSAITRSLLFTKQRRGFCVVYPDLPPRRPPESCLAKFRDKKVAVNSIISLYLNDPEPPPPCTREYLLPGEDLVHFIVWVHFPDPSIKDDRDAVIDYYIKTLAQVVGR